MSKVLGMIGGGQLGMMLTEAAKDVPLISKVVVLDPVPRCPAAQVGAEQIVGGFKDAEAIRELAAKSDIITYEIESGDSTYLKSLERIVEINPSPQTLHTIQDKLRQKSFLRDNGLPVPEFVGVESMDDLRDGISRFGCPALLKARTGGYDGRGNYRIDSPGQAEEAMRRFGDTPLMLERFVPYVMEISVIVARNTSGQVVSYPAAENIHHSNILRQTICPARVNGHIAKKAEEIAMETMHVLRGAGVFGIEMFVLKDGTILINEIAPRVHNSGHHTLQSSETSQFRQHLLAILGMDLGDTSLRGPAVMYNILGPAGYTGPYRSPAISDPRVHLKMYGKETSKPLRKLGHLNIVGGQGEEVSAPLAVLESVLDSAAVAPAS